ncbi:MAG: zinc-dependent metalloprotease family protein, partial [Cytophagaceae bacterium]
HNGFWYAESLIASSNDKLANNQPMHLPLPNSIPNPATNIRLVLTGIYFHRDDNFYEYTLANRSSSDLNNTYGVNINSEINVFAQWHGLYGSNGGAGGIAACIGPCSIPWAKLVGIWNTSTSGHAPWEMGGCLNHEIGHNLGLLHTQQDALIDTPTHADLWSCNNPSGSNNLMDGNCEKDAITPLQLDMMHHVLDNYYANYVVCCTTVPVTAAFSMKSTVASNEKLYLDGSWRWGKYETGYTIDIYQTDAYGSQTNFGDSYSQTFSGQYGLIDLSDLYTFVPGNFYKIKLTVLGSGCNSGDTEEAWVKIEF